MDQEGPRGQIAAVVVTFGIPVQLEETAEQAFSREAGVATVDLPSTCNEVDGSEFKEAPALR